MARPPATAPAKKKHKKPNWGIWSNIPGAEWFLGVPPGSPTPGKNVSGFTGGVASGVTGGVAEGFKNVLIEPIIGDFKRNRGKVIIGIVAGVVLLGGGFKLINGATGGGITKGALTIAAPEIEAASVVKQGLKQSVTRKLHAREPIAPMRYAMRKANP